VWVWKRWPRRWKGQFEGDREGGLLVVQGSCSTS